MLWRKIKCVFILGTLFSTACSQYEEGDECIFSYTNSLGRCAKVEDCDSAKNDFDLNGIRPDFCSTYDAFNNVLVCCRDGNSILQTPAPETSQSRPTTNTNGDTKKICEKMCEEYSRMVTEVVEYIPLLSEQLPFSYTAPKCNFTGLELIIGGSISNLGEFPHMAAIGFTNYDNDYSFLCGGTLISSKFVLTAAHCSRSTEARIPEPVIVRLGDHNLDSAVHEGANPIDVPIRRIHSHPDYRSPVAYHDIALLELAADVPFSSLIRPACLWTNHGVDGHDRAIATGWGFTEIRRGGKKSNILKKVTLNLFDNEFCDRKLIKLRNRNWNGFIDQQMCAGELGGGHDTCQGDSGGPLQVTSHENKCIYYIMGITSIGRGCGEVDKPAIYTRVSEYVTWIENVVWPDNQ